ncbi:PilN domain-containing protein [uncultured Alistipes sp.]|uniref:PilN domain-containing protein n=1 Tax=uncultured Alistipes sp. TaxID=538949 RepID=UPI00259B9E0B|nr:PilN domain-containing protein [uncultured Alistipes sp.]
MNKAILQRIVGSLTVLCVRFEEADRYAMRLFVLEGHREGCRILRKSAEPGADALKKECSGRPVLISVSGYGVVTKPAEDTAIVGKVTSEPETFAWSFSDEKEDSGSISFVRREQVEPLGQRLAENGIPFMDIRYGRAAADPEQEALRQAERFYRDTLKWRTLLRPTPEGRMVAKAAERRLRLPVLGLMLLLLVVNTFASGSLRERHAQQRTVLSAREKKQDASQARSEQRRAAVAEFSRRLPYRHALLLDRVASHVPPAVTLSVLAVQPLSKTLEEGKDPVFVSETLSIRGVTNDASAVSELITGLRSEPLLREARLEGLEQNRESGATEFKITVAL